jgi:2-polyprenyl-3-methyl-5-hydroxy-6-metoxy-1,4-benzoquinol methylase
MPIIYTLDYVLGVHGLAVLRNWARGGETAHHAVHKLIEFASHYEPGIERYARDTTESDVRAGYAAWSASYDNPGNPLVAAEEPVVRAMIDSVAPGRALDAACGTGRHTSYLAERGFEVSGIDASPEMLAVARAKVPRATLEIGDVTRLAFGGETFDFVVCALALDHVGNLDGAIGELARVTRTGGRIVVSTLHPISLLLGGGAFYRTTDGGYGLVANERYLVSDYVAAFAKAGLRIDACVEPLWSDETIAMLTSAALAPETYRVALTGLPIALIWKLVKP